MPPTNPSTTKARRRTVEDAAKRADYRAMSHVREKVQNKAEYKNATAKEREEMLERAMRENMEKRRAEGRDAFSNMAAFRAGGEPSPSVPNPSGLSAISRSLVSNGYVPDSGSSRSSAAEDDDEDSKSDRVPSPPTPDLIMDDGTSEFSFNSAAPTACPVTDLDEREGSAPYVFPQEGANRERSAPAYPGHRSSDKDSEAMAGSQQRRTSSVEQGEHGDEIAALRLEVAQLHKTFLEATGSQGLRKDEGVKEEPQDAPLDMTTDERIRVARLEKRLAQVEGRMDKMHHTMVPNLRARVGRLEQVTEDLASRAGEGCAGEAAKVKEVFRGLKEAFVAVGDIGDI